MGRRTLIAVSALLPACYIGIYEEPDLDGGTFDFDRDPQLSITFGRLEVGDVSSLRIALKNTGSDYLYINDIYMDGEEAAAYTLNASHADLAPGEAVELKLSFALEDIASFDENLFILSNDITEPVYRAAIDEDLIMKDQPDISLNPQLVNFNNFPAGYTTSALFTIKNEGSYPLEILSVDAVGSGAFSMPASLDGLQIEPGASYPVQVTYSPTHEDGDSGALVLKTNDPDERFIEVTLLGNDGGDYEPPEAIFECPEDVASPSSLVFDGSSSYDPEGTALQYSWELLSAPIGSPAILMDTDRVEATLDVPQSGDWKVGLSVTNEYGITSYTTECDFTSTPDNRLQIEMIWGNEADMDLHLAQNEAPLFSRPDDGSFCNPAADWGTPIVEDDDFQLLSESRLGPAVEIFGVFDPADGPYAVRVHAYKTSKPTDVTVNVYVDGALMHSATQTLSDNQVWDAATVLWDDVLGTSVLPAKEEGSIYDSPTRICYDQ